MAWAPDYVTTAELKAFRKIDDGADDVQVALAVTAASRSIDDYCNRQFGVLDSPAEWSYLSRPDLDRGLWVVDIDDLMSTSGLVVSVPTVGTTADYTLEPLNANGKGRPWTRLAFSSNASALPQASDNYSVHVTGLWGWTAVPTAVKQATLLQASRLLSRRKSPFGVAGSPEDGSELRLLARVDPDVAVSLRGYVKARPVG